MSKAVHKSRLPAKQAKAVKRKTDSSAKEQRKKGILVLAVITILAAIPFGLGKYMEFNTPGAFDSGGYVYTAKRILDGAKIGVEEKSSARLGTLMVNILGVWLFGFSETGPELIQMFLQAAALVLMFWTMRKLFGTLSAAVGVIVASVYLSSPLIAKYGNVKEQYMIAFMVIGVSCFVLHQLRGRWWQAMLAGAFLSWAPLFKETGTSAIAAVGLFIVLQPLFKHRSWKQTGIDVLLLLAGASAAIAPLYVWMIGSDVQMGLPYETIFNTAVRMLGVGGQAKETPAYLVSSQELIPFAKQWPRVMRYYLLLILPISLAAGSIVTRVYKMSSAKLSKSKSDTRTAYDRFVLLFAVWWLGDMAFVWISRRSYEQYYLPLNASAAMLGGYLIAVYSDKLNSTIYKSRWVTIGAAGLVCMVIMSQHIFFGIKKSPHSNIAYGYKKRGYVQKVSLISRRRKDNLKGPWEIISGYIRLNSAPTDRIYVWGWYPGIYVKAQRFSPVAEACVITQTTPQELARIVAELLAAFQQQPPKFIVDSRKRHIPMDIPPLELWPSVPKGFMEAEKIGFLPLNKNTIARFDVQWSAYLREKFGENEAVRYETMAPLREFVMQNYEVVAPIGPHVLFERK